MLETALIILFGGGALTWFGMRGSRNRARGWHEAVSSCGLQFVETSPSWSKKIEARAGRMEVRIERSGDAGLPTRIVAVAPGPPDFHQVRIEPESATRGPEIEIGEPPFDSEFSIHGPMLLVSALLDEKTRNLLHRVRNAGRPSLSSGELRVLLPDARVAETLPLLVDLGKRFGEPLDIPGRLAENACHDSIPGVRLHNLSLLIRELPEDPRTAEALRRACSDPSPGIRLRAARELGAEARGVLVDLAEKLEDDAVSAEAVSVLDRELPFERVKAILDLARTRRCLRTARTCMVAIGRSGAAAAVDTLTEVLEKESGELAPAAARALEETGNPAAEAPLIQALQRDQADVRAMAARALGRIGSTAAVLPLKEAAERSRLDLELRRVARQAIAEIQSRAQGASPGQLSLAGGEVGQLSLAEDPAGRLSLPPGERPE